jgi:hypothetical protein
VRRLVLFVAFAPFAFPAAAWADVTATEGIVFSGKVVDIGNCAVTSATISWGDGTPTSAGASDGATGISGAHTYVDERAASGYVYYMCSNISTLQYAAFQVTVQDAPLTGRAVPGIAATAGEPLTAVVAHFDDGNRGATADGFYHPQISWGDGTTDLGSIVSAAGGGFDITGSHTYSKAGNPTVKTVITDPGGSTTTVNSIVAVHPPVIRARFTISPNPTCTGVLVTVDGSISTTPNPPITRYRFTEAIVPVIPTYVPRVPYEVVADGLNPRPTRVFGYDEQFNTEFPTFANAQHLGVYVVNPRLITLTVTDRTGATASDSQQLDFAQSFSDESRARCPGVHRRVRASHFATKRIGFRVTKHSLTARFSCATVADCAGELKLFVPPFRSGRRAAAARTHRGAKPVLIAASRFFYIPGHQTATIATNLTRSGRRLVARGKPLTANAQLTTVAPTGRATTQSLPVTLIGNKR